MSLVPALECTSCGNHVGHLFPYYFKLTSLLNAEVDEEGVTLHQALVNGDLEVDTGKINEADFDTNGQAPLGNIWTNYLKKYYVWVQSAEPEDKNDYEAKNLVARALLEEVASNADREGKEKWVEHTSTEATRYCCTNTFQNDATNIY